MSWVSEYAMNKLYLIFTMRLVSEVDKFLSKNYYYTFSYFFYYYYQIVELNYEQ